MRVLLVLSVALLVASAFSARGVDTSIFGCQSANIDNWRCLKNNGYSFAIIEAWNGGYQFINEIKRCTDDAWAAGFAHVDVYVFMCPNCRGNNPADQAVQRIVNSLNSLGVNYGQIWVDVEQCDGCWNDLNSNCNYVKTVVDEFSRLLGAWRVGVYSSKYSWSSTVGTCPHFTSHPLWYAHYDQDPSFSDAWAYQFGGWTKPAMKQYYDHGPGCNIDVDVNYYPDGMFKVKTPHGSGKNGTAVYLVRTK